MHIKQYDSIILTKLKENLDSSTRTKVTTKTLYVLKKSVSNDCHNYYLIALPRESPAALPAPIISRWILPPAHVSSYSR